MRWLPFACCLVAACGGDERDLGAVLPAGATVPAAADDEPLASQIEAADGVEVTPVPRITAFAHGRNVHYWSFPAGSGALGEHHVLCRLDAGGECQPIDDHPPILAAVPGDAGYSPFGAIVRHPVTAAWSGECIPSVAALADAERLGLIDPRYEGARRYGHIVIVDPAVELDAGDGARVAPTPVYALDREVRGFDFGRADRWRQPTTRDDLPAAPFRNVYVLRRDGETTPIHERARDLDLTGDGDRVDTNNVFGVDLGDPDYTPLWREVLVVVDAGYASIDTAADESMAAYRSSDDMFTVDETTYEITPIPGRIVSFELTPMLIDCPLQVSPGAL